MPTITLTKIPRVNLKFPDFYQSFPELKAEFSRYPRVVSTLRKDYWNCSVVYGVPPLRTIAVT